MHMNVILPSRARRDHGEVRVLYHHNQIRADTSNYGLFSATPANLHVAATTYKYLVSPRLPFNWAVTWPVMGLLEVGGPFTSRQAQVP